MQARFPVRQQAQADVEQRRPAGIDHLLRHRGAGLLQMLGDAERGEGAQVLHLNQGAGQVLERLLFAARQDPHAHHVVPGDDCGQGLLQPVGVQGRTIDFDIAVA